MAALTPACQTGPWSLILRDHHAGNLMLLDRPGVLAAGLIDFQDAGPGPVAYDLLSLLEDARRDVADDLAAAMIERYRAAFPDLDRAAFDHGFAVLAAVRHARVLGIFVRLAAAGRDGYLVHLPRVKRLLARALRHEALTDVSRWLTEHAPRALEE
jgi:aminoglycoside/choline kinase family phosphotransferase